MNNYFNFLNINNQILDSIDMTINSHLINSIEHREYFISKSGTEHYRLLHYISSQHNNISIIDIGTFKGCSALAFSANPNNKIFSFDISNQIDINKIPNNITFYCDEISTSKYIDLIKSSQYILLDTIHEGTYEQNFLLYLQNIKYKGILLLDDIFLNNNMRQFWEHINLPKIDLTHIGHSTGTGIVFLN